MSESHGDTTTTRIPIEITASLLAALTVFLTLVKVPIWATFISWGGIFLLQETRLLGAIRRTWPPLLVGVVASVFTILANSFLARATGNILLLTTLFEAILLFFVALVVLVLGRVQLFAASAFIFFSFACVDIQVSTQPLYLAALSILVATWLGAPLAWASFKLMLPLPSLLSRSTLLPPRIQLDVSKPAVFVVNEHGTVTARDHPFPDERIIFAIDAPQEHHGTSPVPASYMGAASAHHNGSTALHHTLSLRNEYRWQQTEIEACLKQLICEHLKIDALYVDNDFNILGHVRDTQALARFLDALHEYFQLTARDLLSPHLTMSDLVTLIVNQQGATQSHDTNKVILTKKEA